MAPLLENTPLDFTILGLNSGTSMVSFGGNGKIPISKEITINFNFVSSLLDSPQQTEYCVHLISSHPRTLHAYGPKFNRVYVGSLIIEIYLFGFLRCSFLVAWVLPTRVSPRSTTSRSMSRTCTDSIRMALTVLCAASTKTPLSLPCILNS